MSAVQIFTGFFCIFAAFTDAQDRFQTELLMLNAKVIELQDRFQTELNAKVIKLEDRFQTELTKLEHQIKELRDANARLEEKVNALQEDDENRETFNMQEAGENRTLNVQEVDENIETFNVQKAGENLLKKTLNSSNDDQDLGRGNLQ